MDYLRKMFATFCATDDEVEARAVLAFSLLVGSHFLAADHGSRSRREALELAVAVLLR